MLGPVAIPVETPDAAFAGRRLSLSGGIGPTDLGEFGLGGISRSTLYEKIASGEIAAVKVGRRTYIAHDELERYVRVLTGSDEHLIPATAGGHDAVA